MNEYKQTATSAGKTCVAEVRYLTSMSKELAMNLRKRTRAL